MMVPSWSGVYVHQTELLVPTPPDSQLVAESHRLPVAPLVLMKLEYVTTLPGITVADRHELLVGIPAA